MKYSVIMGAIFPMLIIMSQSHSVFAYGDPKHCDATLVTQ